VSRKDLTEHKKEEHKELTKSKTKYVRVQCTYIAHIENEGLGGAYDREALRRIRM
jgi:hypothetical protein